jgi:hypothetical protein
VCTARLIDAFFSGRGDFNVAPGPGGGKPGLLLLLIDKGRGILSGRNVDLYGARGSRACIDFLKVFPQLVNRDTDDCVHLRIEIAPAPESFNGERVFSDLAGLTLKMLLANELQHSGEVAGSAKHSGSQEPIKLFMLSLARVEISCHS